MNATAKPTIVKIHNGRMAFDRTYANRSQAYAAAARWGGAVYQFGRPFYVVVDDAGK